MRFWHRIVSNTSWDSAVMIHIMETGIIKSNMLWAQRKLMVWWWFTSIWSFDWYKAPGKLYAWARPGDACLLLFHISPPEDPPQEYFSRLLFCYANIRIAREKKNEYWNRIFLYCLIEPISGKGTVFPY